MALIVETGLIVPNAESYVSVAEATTYHAERGQGDAWEAVEDKEAALRLATSYMEAAYRSRWLSFRVSALQALSWPRAWVTLPDAPYGYGSFAAFVPNNVIPVEVKRACAELALRTSSLGDLAPDISPQTIREKVGPIEVEYNKNAPPYLRYRSIDMLLSPYFKSTGPSVELVRA